MGTGTRRTPRGRAGGALAVGAAVAGLGAGASWLWRHQADIAFSRPVNEWAFTHMSAVLPTDPVPRASAPRPLPYEPGLRGFTYGFGGERRTLAELHRRTHTTGFAVLHRGVLVGEDYPGRFASPTARFQLFSLTKSVTSMLLGIALEEGALGSTADKVVSYVPDLAGSAYDGPTVEDLLHMSSGVEFVEDYADPESSFGRFERAVSGGGSLLEVVRSLPRAAEPGGTFNYSTVDSQVLGWVLESATGMPLARYAHSRLWSRIGAERDAYYFLTRGRPRTALGGGSLNAAVRDMARVGLLMARGGALDGRQIVPAAWVERSRGADLPHLAAGALGADLPRHYGYANQWWTLDGERRSFTGIGIHGQYLWVDPEADVVVVKTSAWNTAEDEDRDAETVAALTALVAHLEATA
ncbi:serine hydrolase [Streptomyces sp. SID8379]|uniref:serine hydrolase domain-containing protein n=1 Tax=unclassified Streptomyces TaxID=2593676 RepID=UPI000368F4C9|nr:MULTISPECIES: serine hydrolase [unclassified Streptomyces]MYW62659.1 serine hydrolase [Streptomyces sp. SID8379]